MIKKGEGNLKRKKGFSLIELLVVIAIMIILIAVMTPFLVGYIDSANEAVCQNNAKILMDAAQVGIATASYKEYESYVYAMKYNYNGQQIARFTNNSLAQAESGVVSGRKSGASDKCIGETILELFPSAKGYTQGTNPIDTNKSTLYMVNHQDEFGTMPFAFTYDKDGRLIYFEVICNGYFFKMINGVTTVEKAADDVYFENWPTSAHKMPGAGDW